MTDLEQLKTWRRSLHKIPETGLNTPCTAEYLKEQLADMDLEILPVKEAGSSFTAFMDNGKDWTVAYRTDMDALPVTENTTHDFPSEHPGCMHACGHDGHMTIMLATANELYKIKDQLDCNILFIAQSGEESPGGAQWICQSGVFQKYNVKQVYGLHLMPDIPKGIIKARPLETMARCAEVHISIKGLSVHAAKYKEGHDAMQAGAELLYKIYQLEASLPDDVWRLLRFGSFHAGTACNVVSDHCQIEGTLRSYQDETFDYLANGMMNLACEMEEKYGVKVTINIGEGYPAVMNHEQLTKNILEATDKVELLDKPQLISEDFSFYQHEAPGIFFFLGTGTGIPLHSSNFDFDEALLQKGADLFVELALKAKELQV